MNKKVSKALASAALTAFIAGIVPTHQVSAANAEFQRLSGKDRYLTAVEVSKAGWTDGAEYAIVVNGEAYADALSAAPFAKKNNAPVLLTSSKGMANETLNELKRLKVKKVYVIGGTGVVPSSILERIKKNVTTDVERVGGLDRYATSTKIAEKLGTVNEAILASGEGYADALSAAPVAAIRSIPVLLTKAGELPKSTSEYIKAQGIKKTFVVGGTASVSDKVKGQVPGAVRIGGNNRWETNTKIIKEFSLDFNFDGAYIALANGPTGKEFADALTASAIAAKGGHPVIISNKTAEIVTTNLINEKLSPTAKITAIGGIANISNALIKLYQVEGQVIQASQNITGNAVVSKDSVELKDMKVTGNLYLEGNNPTVSNVEVSGTIFINPGEEGNAALSGVTADKIVVLSGANKSIHLNNVSCNILYILSKTETRIALEGTANIKNVEIFSSAILDAKNKFNGTIVVLNNLYIKNVEFLGEYSKTITVESDKDNVKLPGDTTTPGGGDTDPAEDALKNTIEKAIKNYDEFKENNPGEILSYPTVTYSTSNKTVTVTMDEAKKDKLISETFDAKGKDGVVTESRLKELERLISLTGINVGEESLIDYIANSEAIPNYISNGEINYGKIADDFKTGKFNFKYLEMTFNALMDKMNNKENNIVPDVTVEGLKLKNVESSESNTVVSFQNAAYGKVKEDIDSMFGVGTGDLKSSYAELTYADLVGTYTLTFEDLKGNNVTYKVAIDFAK